MPEDVAASKGPIALIRSVLTADPEHGWLPAVMLVMTATSGVVDAVSILSLGHVFVANMTGNLLFIGLAFGGARGFSLSTSLVALGSFGAGVILCRTLTASRPLSRLLILRDAMAVEVAFLAAALILALVSRPNPPLGLRDVMAGMCAVALGMQNGVVRRLGVPDLTTSVMTRTLVGLLWDAGGHREVTVRQVSSVASLVIGAILGATLVTQVGRSAGLALAVSLAGGTASWCAWNAARRLTWT
jgi:uncharacterized membrane protein YoaK (UPF0700 family)